jgi:hypothetical protein
MLTPFNVFAVVVVLLLWWIGSNEYAIAKRAIRLTIQSDSTDHKSATIIGHYRNNISM